MKNNKDIFKNITNNNKGFRGLAPIAPADETNIKAPVILEQPVFEEPISDATGEDTKNESFLAYEFPSEEIVAEADKPLSLRSRTLEKSSENESADFPLTKLATLIDKDGVLEKINEYSPTAANKIGDLFNKISNINPTLEEAIGLFDICKDLVNIKDFSNSLPVLSKIKDITSRADGLLNTITSKTANITNAIPTIANLPTAVDSGLAGFVSESLNPTAKAIINTISSSTGNSASTNSISNTISNITSNSSNLLNTISSTANTISNTVNTISSTVNSINAKNSHTRGLQQLKRGNIAHVLLRNRGFGDLLSNPAVTAIANAAFPGAGAALSIAGSLANGEVPTDLTAIANAAFPGAGAAISVASSLLKGEDPTAALASLADSAFPGAGAALTAASSLLKGESPTAVLASLAENSGIPGAGAALNAASALLNGESPTAALASLADSVLPADIKNIASKISDIPAVLPDLKKALSTEQFNKLLKTLVSGITGSLGNIVDLPGISGILDLLKKELSESAKNLVSSATSELSKLSPSELTTEATKTIQDIVSSIASNAPEFPEKFEAEVMQLAAEEVEDNIVETPKLQQLDKNVSGIPDLVTVNRETNADLRKICFDLLQADIANVAKPASPLDRISQPLIEDETFRLLVEVSAFVKGLAFYSRLLFATDPFIPQLLPPDIVLILTGMAPIAGAATMPLEVDAGINALKVRLSGTLSQLTLNDTILRIFENEKELELVEASLEKNTLNIEKSTILAAYYMENFRNTDADFHTLKIQDLTKQQELLMADLTRMETELTAAIEKIPLIEITKIEKVERDIGIIGAVLADVPLPEIELPIPVLAMPELLKKIGQFITNYGKRVINVLKKIMDMINEILEFLQLTIVEGSTASGEINVAGDDIVHASDLLPEILELCEICLDKFATVSSEATVSATDVAAKLLALDSPAEGEAGE